MNELVAKALMDFVVAFVSQQAQTSAAGNHPQAVANLGILGMFLSLLAPAAPPVAAPVVAAPVPPSTPNATVLNPLQQLLAGIVSMAQPINASVAGTAFSAPLTPVAGRT